MTGLRARGRGWRLVAVVGSAVLAAAVLPGTAAATPTYVGGASVSWGYQEGDVLTANPGTWMSTGSIMYGYAWFDENSVALGSGPSYTVSGRDVGHRIYAAITASDGTAPSLTVNTSTVGPMRYRAPVNVERPTVGGALKQGSTLVANPGKWVSGGASTAPIQIGYSWYRGCTPAPNPDCTASGEIGSTSSLTLTAAEVGRPISLTVTASYPDGLGGQASSSTWLGDLGLVAAVPAASHEYSSSIAAGTALRGTVSWTAGAVGARTVEFWVDGATKVAELPADADGTATSAFDTALLADGRHDLGLAVTWLDGSERSTFWLGYVQVANASRVAVRPLIAGPASPARPLAGRRFVVTFAVTRSDDHRPLTSGRMIGDPSVSGRVIPHVESFVAGRARLAFTIPRTARHRLLTVKLTIRLGGQSATRAVGFLVG